QTRTYLYDSANRDWLAGIEELADGPVKDSISYTRNAAGDITQTLIKRGVYVSGYTDPVNPLVAGKGKGGKGGSGAGIRYCPDPLDPCEQPIPPHWEYTTYRKSLADYDELGRIRAVRGNHDQNVSYAY